MLYSQKTLSFYYFFTAMKTEERRKYGQGLICNCGKILWIARQIFIYNFIVAEDRNKFE
jgi:hypothetical protein